MPGRSCETPLDAHANIGSLVKGAAGLSTCMALLRAYLSGPGGCKLTLPLQAVTGLPLGTELSTLLWRMPGSPRRGVSLNRLGEALRPQGTSLLWPCLALTGLITWPMNPTPRGYIG